MQTRSSAACAAVFAISLGVGVVQAQQEPHHPARPDTSALADSMMQMPMGEHGMLPGALGISASRTGSGTSWLPDASPMHAAHFMAGRWSLMVHGVAFAMYDYQSTRRGHDQVI